MKNDRGMTSQDMMFVDDLFGSQHEDLIGEYIQELLADGWLRRAAEVSTYYLEAKMGRWARSTHPH